MGDALPGGFASPELEHRASTATCLDAPGGNRLNDVEQDVEPKLTIGHEILFEPVPTIAATTQPIPAARRRW